MPQLNLYINEDLAGRIRQAADDADLSVSRYLAELVRRAVETEWPEGFFEEVVGGWQGEPLVRAAQDEYEERESLALVG